MRDFRETFQRFVADEDGATAIEYGLIAAMLAVGLLVALGSLQGNVGDLFNGVSTKSIDALNNIDDVRPPDDDPEEPA
jgi:pilus assembly protein Flp/PilA